MGPPSSRRARGVDVTLIKRTRDGVRKILISGGGRCNVLPAVLDESRFVTNSSPNTLRKMLRVAAGRARKLLQVSRRRRSGSLAIRPALDEMADRTASPSDPLSRYSATRNFAQTPQPRGVRAKKAKALAFVIQKHWVAHVALRLSPGAGRQEPWFLFKKRDAWARPLAEYDVIVALPDSVVKKPLGRLEERAPRGGVAPSARTRSPQSAADLPGAVKAKLPATLAGAAARHPGHERAGQRRVEL